MQTQRAQYRVLAETEWQHERVAQEGERPSVPLPQVDVFSEEVEAGDDLWVGGYGVGRKRDMVVSMGCAWYGVLFPLSFPHSFPFSLTILIPLFYFSHFPILSPNLVVYFSHFSYPLSHLDQHVLSVPEEVNGEARQPYLGAQYRAYGR